MSLKSYSGLDRELADFRAANGRSRKEARLMTVFRRMARAYRRLMVRYETEQRKKERGDDD